MNITRLVCSVLLCICGTQDTALIGGEVTVKAKNRLVSMPAADDQVSSDEATPSPGPSIVEHRAFKPIQSAVRASPFAQQDKEKPLKVNIYPMYTKLPQQGKALIAIELDVQRNWHINANPSSPDFLVPTTVELKTKQKVKLTKVKYPKHHPLIVQGSDQPYHVYDGKAIVYGLLEIDEVDTTKVIELEFHVRFQGCNSTQCLPPDMVSMEGKLQVAEAGEPLEKNLKNAGKFPKLKTGKESPDDVEEPFEPLEPKGDVSE